uniref:Phosphorylase b kinase regulatory subunit n=1 Tax=Syphacia muris TaxID=451379 RepID=A0A0N5AQ64_9BILA
MGLGKKTSHYRRPTAVNLRLRRLTRAYLAPIRCQLPRTEKSAIAEVDAVYYMVQKMILDYQSVTSGLFPRYASDKTVAYVKDSIYCALACWACSVAYNRIDDDRGRQTELRQSAVKTMRGIMFAWMQQCDLLDEFKETNSVECALHARFSLSTGMVLSTTSEYGNLQMDLIALYLLALVEMTAGGAQIIYTHDEVCFVQNLVFYVERTYRTPDYGMWERGTRYNVGDRELHASSLGIVKAALEAINGFNLYGAYGTSSSVVYVDIDGHNRNRTTFETILPRESNSKNTDSALLLAVGWPAFATHDRKLYDVTVDKCEKLLEGRYGMKRFFRDGYHTEIEDASRSYYDIHETYRFQDVESQFPMFFAYRFITAHLRGHSDLADKYWEKLSNLLVADYKLDGMMVLPECYMIEEEKMDDERQKPGSQEFYPFTPAEFGLHLWSNAVYLIALLLRKNLVHATDIDPICRHLPASQRPQNRNRHSAFQGSLEGNPVVQVALIAESSRLQMMLSTYGISTQTPLELEPVQIWPSWKLVKIFESLGKNEKLHLGGRPARPFGPLNTSKIFKLFGDTILCYPLLFEVKDFYMISDPAILIDGIKLDIEFVSKRWKLAGRPTYCMVLREENVTGEYFGHLLDLLIAMKNGYVNGVRVRIGRVHQLLNRGCTEHIDFAPFEQIAVTDDLYENFGTKKVKMLSELSLNDVPEESTDLKELDFASKSDHDLYEIIKKQDVTSLRSLAFANSVLSWRYGMNFVVDGETLQARMEKIYRQSCAWRRWWLVRYCAARLHKSTNSLAPGITNMLVRGKQVTLGMRGYKEVTISSPTTPGELADILFNCCPVEEPQAAVLQQELIIACSDLICQKEEAFDGVLTIRLSWLADAIALMLDYVQSATSLEPKTPLTGIPSTYSGSNSNVYDLAPTVIKDVVSALITRKNWHLLTPLQSRRLNGSLNRVPSNFYDSVWKILERTPGGIVIAGKHLPQQPTLNDMTKYELNFAYEIEGMMSVIAHPEYRQVVVELLCIIAIILERNPELVFSGKLDLDNLVKTAFNHFCDDMKIEDRKDMTPFYQLEDTDLTVNSTAYYLAKTVIDVLLGASSLNRRKRSMFMPNDVLLPTTSERFNDESNCSIM